MSLRFKIRSPGAFSSVKATIDPADESRVWGPKFRHPYRGAGSGSFFLQNDDADIDNIDYGDLVIVEKDGTPVFGWIVKDKLRHSVAKAAAAGVPSGEKFTEISGPGLKAFGIRSVVRPKNGGRFQPKEQVRPFDWTAVEFDFSTWTAAEQIKRVDETSAHWQGFPQFVPDPTIYWIGEDGAVDTDADVGVRLLRAPSFTIENDDTLASIFGWIDNEGIYYLNGVEIMRVPTFEECRYIDLVLPAGEYFLSGFGRNLEPTVVGANPFAFGFGVYIRGSDGSFAERLLVSDSSSKILALPSTTPGLPLGAPLRILREENQALGEIPGIGLDFTDTTATNGATFPTATDASAVVKESVTDYLLSIEDALADVEVDPATFKIQLFYPRGSRGSSTGVEFTDGVSLNKLDHQTNDDRVDKLLIDYAGGYTEVGTGEFAKPLTVSQVGSEDAAQRVGTEVLVGRDTPSKRFAATIVTGTGREPYDDFNPGDSVDIDDEDGSPSEQLVQAIVLEGLDRAGRPKWQGEFGDPIDSIETVAERAVRKIAATRSATNVQNILPSIQAAGGDVYKQQLLKFSYEPSDLQISQETEPPATRDIAYLSVVLDEADAEDHTFTVNKNGAPMTSLDVTIAAGDTEGRAWADIGEYQLIAGAGGDKVTLEFTGQPIRFTATLALR